MQALIVNAVLRDTFSILWPFHKEPLLITLAHLMVGTLFCQAVVYQALAMHFHSPHTLPTPVLAGLM